MIHVINTSNMNAAKSIIDMRKIRCELAEPVGFVPTMGYLHEGHLSLIRRAKEENRSVVASLFVNPTQFAPHEDFESYPRDLHHDISLLEGLGIDVIFTPSVTELYPPGFSICIELGKITKRLEGASRPTHFRGVATIVAKLFNIVQPARAYFGQKDAQQLTVIRNMVTDLNMNLEIVSVPTIREPDGLAMSSRNASLNTEQRQAAMVLYQALKLSEILWSKGEKDAEKIRQKMLSLTQQEPLARVDYISVADAETLEELETVKPPALVSIAVKIGGTRLIDNVILS